MNDSICQTNGFAKLFKSIPDNRLLIRNSIFYIDYYNFIFFGETNTAYPIKIKKATQEEHCLFRFINGDPYVILPIIRCRDGFVCMLSERIKENTLRIRFGYRNVSSRNFEHIIKIIKQKYFKLEDNLYIATKDSEIFLYILLIINYIKNYTSYEITFQNVIFDFNKFISM